MIEIGGKPCRLIGTEEHYVPPQYAKATRPLAGTSWSDLDLEDLRFFLYDERGRPWFDPLSDVAEQRMKAMDAAGIDVALLSTLAPGVQLLSPQEGSALATAMNDELAGYAKANPRLGGLALFAPQDPHGAAKEIERATQSLGLNGVIVYSHTNGEYLDDPKYWEIFEACEATGAAVYIHPRNPPSAHRAMLERDGEKILTSGIWGFTMETSLHAVRLLVSGVFDRFPRLQIVLGHMGEGLPYWLYRLDYMYERGFRRQGRGLAKRLPSEYFRDNFHVTISGLHDHPTCQPTLDFCHAVVGPERIMFASDFPFQSSEQASAVLRASKLPEDDLRAIAYRNAERVFRVKPLA